MPNLVVVPAYTQVLLGRNSKESSSHTDRTGHIKCTTIILYVRKYVYNHQAGRHEMGTRQDHPCLLGASESEPVLGY